MSELFQSLQFPNGKKSKNRFFLAPLTNTQSHEDGTLSEDEYRWLIMRAQGGFGATMTCATYVDPLGKGFPGQLGLYDDGHIQGHQRLASAIKSEGSLAFCQLHHAGMRSPKELIGQDPLCPSDNEKFGAQGMTLNEIDHCRKAFIEAAIRAQRATYDGVEIHGAHGYILAQFLSADLNHRDDKYGGSLENRSRLIREILQGVRAQCGDDFLLGLRLSPERFGMKLAEIKSLYQSLIKEKLVDFIHLSLWDAFKEPEEEEFKGSSLLSQFLEIDRGEVKLIVAGNIRSRADAEKILASGADFSAIGRAAIAHHDFPIQAEAHTEFRMRDLPLTEAYLRKEGLGPKFIKYMQNWKGFVSQEDE